MNASPEVPAALLLGLLGGTHCIGMCGGISGALAFALGKDCEAWRRHLLLVLYSVGRVSSYVAMGALAGSLVQAGGGADMPAWRIAAGVLLILMALFIAGWSRALAPLERAGHGLWTRIQRVVARIGPIDRAYKALLAGMAWGWLPCGLVYSSLSWSATSGSAAQAALLMGCFGLGTMPAVVASGAFAAALRRLLQHRGLRLAAAFCVCAFGVWTIATALGGGHVHHHHH